MPARDQHRVLAVEADAAPGGGLAVDVLVRVDEHAVGAAEAPPEHVELLAQLRVSVVPGVARKPSLPASSGVSGSPVAERGGDDACARRASSVSGWHERSGCAIVNFMSGEEPAARRSTDVPLGLRVRLRAGDSDRVKTELVSQPDGLDRASCDDCAP